VNQILITGEEVLNQKVKKQKTVLPINGIVIFYAICIIILGICMISGSVYAGGKINQVAEASIRPEISIERNDDNNTITISVTHIRGIQSLVYSWNDEEEIMINGKNKKSVTETIDLIGGENTLKVSAIEENGQKQTLEKTFIVGNIPEIEIVEAVDDGVKVAAKSEVELDYLEYSWDNQEMQKINFDDGQKEYEGIISAPRGKHTLKIGVVDKNGMTAEIEREIIGDTEPTVKVQPQLVNGRAAFVIDAEDDENILTLEIIHNGGQKQVIEVNSKTYHKEIIMTEGETNTLIVTATNQNNLQKTRRVKFDNK